jgi:hypothetical protein
MFAIVITRMVAISSGLRRRCGQDAACAAGRMLGEDHCKHV